jgi:hypothetical protein
LAPFPHLQYRGDYRRAQGFTYIHWIWNDFFIKNEGRQIPEDRWWGEETIHGSATFGWRPNESSLAGRKKRTKKDKASEERDEK